MICGCGMDLGDEPAYQECDWYRDTWYNVWWCPNCDGPVLDYATPMIWVMPGELVAQDPAKRPGYIERAKEQMELPLAWQ